MQQLSRYWQSRLWIVVGLLALGSASAEEGSEAVDTADNQMAEERGYFFGYSFGNMLQQGGNPDVDLAALMQGLKDSLAASPPALDSAAQTAVMAQSASTSLEEDRYVFDPQKRAGRQFRTRDLTQLQRP